MSEQICLIVDLNGSTDLPDTLEERTQNIEFAYPISYTQFDGAIEYIEFAYPISYTQFDGAIEILGSGNVVMMVIFAEESSDNLFTILNEFKNKVGAIGAFQGIVCDEPDPQFMTEVFDYGVEQFLSKESWPEEIEALCNSVHEVLEDTESSEAMTIKLNQSIIKGDQSAIAQVEEI